MKQLFDCFKFFLIVFKYLKLITHETCEIDYLYLEQKVARNDQQLLQHVSKY